MRYRIAEFCQLPEPPSYQDHTVFQLDTPEFFQKALFEDPGYTTPADHRSAIDGIAKAAHVLNCDFVIANPPQYYRSLLEERLSELGMVLIYPEVGVTKDGDIHLIRFKAAEQLPEPTPTLHLQERYESWLNTHYVNINEENLAMCQDPWRLFIDHAIRGLHRRNLH